MNRRRYTPAMRRLGILAVAVVMVIAACSGNGDDIPPEDPADVIVGRIVEARFDTVENSQFNEDDPPAWFPYPRDQVAAPGARSTISEDGQISEIKTGRQLAFAFTDGEGELSNAIGVARFRLTVRSDGFTYDILVAGECYDAVTVGTPWPSEAVACE